jgi:hypothetical protein
MLPVMTPLALHWWYQQRVTAKPFNADDVPSDTASTTLASESPIQNDHPKTGHVADSRSVNGTIRRPSASKFEFRTAVWCISPLLLAADMVYFTAMANPAALVSVISTLRRCSVVVALVLGASRLGEVNLHQKAFCVGGILLGAAMILMGK